MQPTAPYYRLKITTGSVTERASFSLYYGEGTFTDPDGETLAGLAANAVTQLQGPLLACLMDDRTVIEMRLSKIHADLRVDVLGTVSGDAGGFSEGESLPADSAICMQRRSISTAKNKNGRVYIPWVPEALSAESNLTAPGMTAYGPIAVAICTPLEFEDTFLWPATIDWKEGKLVPVYNTAINRMICSRADRRVKVRQVVHAANLNNPLPMP